jgi:hypothetical protein
MTQIVTLGIVKLERQQSIWQESKQRGIYAIKEARLKTFFFTVLIFEVSLVPCCFSVPDSAKNGVDPTQSFG